MEYLSVLQSLRESSPDFVNYIFIFISEVLPKLLTIYAGVVFWCINKREGAAILVGYSFAYQVNQLVKNIACIYRPWVLYNNLHVAPAAIKSATGYSFPSGHTVTVASLAGGYAIWQKKRIGVVILMIICTILTAFSRNWLGAHTLKDVLTAVFIAAVVVMIVSICKNYLTVHPEKDTIFMIVTDIVAILIVVFLSLKKYPVDYDENGVIRCDPFDMLKDCYTACGMITGAITGWWCERHFIKFEMPSSKKRMVLRGVIGVISFCIIFYGSGYITNFIPKHYDHFVKYFFIFLYPMFIYPMIFNLFTKKEKVSE